MNGRLATFTTALTTDWNFETTECYMLKNIFHDRKDIIGALFFMWLGRSTQYTP